MVASMAGSMVVLMVAMMVVWTDEQKAEKMALLRVVLTAELKVAWMEYLSAARKDAHWVEWKAGL